MLGAVYPARRPEPRREPAATGCAGRRSSGRRHERELEADARRRGRRSTPSRGGAVREPVERGAARRSRRSRRWPRAARPCWRSAPTPSAAASWSSAPRAPRASAAASWRSSRARLADAAVAAAETRVDRGRVAGVVLADWAALAPRPGPGRCAAATSSSSTRRRSRTSTAWSSAATATCTGSSTAREVEFALRVHADEWPSRSSLAELYRALGARGGGGLEPAAARARALRRGPRPSALARGRGAGGAGAGRARAPALGRLRPKSGPQGRILVGDGSGGIRGVRRLPRPLRGGSAIPERAKTDLAPEDGGARRRSIAAATSRSAPRTRTGPPPRSTRSPRT